MALTSLHYYFPWAIKTLLKWCTFCLVTGRRPQLDLDTRRYFEIGDREDLGYGEKLGAYRRLADEYFEADRYHDFCDSRLSHVDELVLDWVGSADFDRLLVDHRPLDLPGPRARPLHRASSRPRRAVGARAGAGAGVGVSGARPPLQPTGSG